MDKDRSTERGPNVIEGADAAALGQTDGPASAPEAARIESAERLVPGAGFDDDLPTEAKPWSSSLAARDQQAGVANDPPDAQRVDNPLPDAGERGRQE